MNGVGFVDLLFVSQVQDKPKCFKTVSFASLAEWSILKPMRARQFN